MFFKLFLLFTSVTALELLILMPVASSIGIGWTVLMIIVTALIGAKLAQREGARAWKQVMQDLSMGMVPNDSIIDGLIVLVGCVLLVTPGVLTDLVGLSVLFPIVRRPIRAILKNRFSKKLELQSWAAADRGGSGFVFTPPTQSGYRSDYDESIIDITPDPDRSHS